MDTTREKDLDRAWAGRSAVRRTLAHEVFIAFDEDLSGSISDDSFSQLALLLEPEVRLALESCDRME